MLGVIVVVVVAAALLWSWVIEKGKLKLFRRIGILLPASNPTGIHICVSVR